MMQTPSSTSKNPSEAVQLAAVKQDEGAIQYIKKLTTRKA